MRLSLAISYRKVPILFPITAPKIGIGITACPSIEDNALTDTSIHKVCEFSKNSSFVIKFLRNLYASSAIPNEAVHNELATAAGVAV